MRTLLLALCFVTAGTSCLSSATAAPQQPRTTENVSKEEFRKKQKDYIIRKAELNPREATYFFPLFFELQDRKKVLNDDMAAKMKKATEQDLDERQYESVINQVLNAQNSLEELDREYINRYRKYLSNKKIFKILLAETAFRLDMLKSASSKQNSK